MQKFVMALQYSDWLKKSYALISRNSSSYKLAKTNTFNKFPETKVLPDKQTVIEFPPTKLSRYTG